MDVEKLEELVKRVPEIKAQYSTSSFFPDKKIYHDKELFISWKHDVLMFLSKNPDIPLKTEIETTFRRMQGVRDEVDLNSVVASLDALLKDNISSDSHLGSVKTRKGELVYSAFEKYTLEKQIGEGGNAKVWKVKDESGNVYALKFIERGNENTIKRFKNETFFCMKHSHPNIVQVLDYGTFGDSYAFYVMPLYGQTLRNRITSGIDSNVAISIFIGIIEGLKYAHEHGVIHRDIKPENILFFDGSNIPVIADFGIAHYSEEELATIVETKKSDRMANFQYAAPEQRMRGVPATPQTDIFSVALILNEMFTKEIPLASDHKRISEISQDYAFLDTLFDSMYKQNPKERLFPENSILTRLKVLSEEQKAKVEKEAIEAAVTQFLEPEKIEYKITDAKVEKWGLVFKFNKKLPVRWVSILCNGKYSHCSILGYDTYRLSLSNGNEMVMNLKGGEDSNIIQKIASYMKEWVSVTNIEFHNQQIEISRTNQKEREREQREALEWLDRSTSINAVLSEIDFS